MNLDQLKKAIRNPPDESHIGENLDKTEIGGNVHGIIGEFHYKSEMCDFCLVMYDGWHTTIEDCSDPNCVHHFMFADDEEDYCEAEEDFKDRHRMSF
jgi:hypothetical protein